MGAVTVDVALVNGRIRTGDPRRPVADAMAVSGAVLALVGSSAEVRKLAGRDARVINLKGGIVIAVPDADAVFRRGATASFIVLSQLDEMECFRMVDGAILLDALS